MAMEMSANADQVVGRDEIGGEHGRPFDASARDTANARAFGCG